MVEQRLPEWNDKGLSHLEPTDEEGHHDEGNYENQYDIGQQNEKWQYEDKWNNFMFGSGRGQPPAPPEEDFSQNQSYINYEELMYHIDTLMVSVQNLKPLFQKFYPFVEQYLKKK